LDIFSSSLRVGVFVEAGTDEEVTEDADGTAEARILPLSPCCCSIHKVTVCVLKSFQHPDNTASNEWMINELKRIWKEVVMY
jgi:hypothetical protein